MNQLLCGALEWLDVNRDRFDIFRIDPDPPPEEDQALGELALLCRQLVLRRACDQVDVEPLLAVLQSVESHQLFTHRLRRVNDALLPHVLVVSALQEAGLSSRVDIEVLQSMCDRSNALFAERPPHRLLELRRMLDSVGLRHRLPSYTTLARMSNLGRDVDPIRLTNYDIYSITHTLFFLTDFGRLVPRGLTSARRRLACATVHQLLGMQIHRGNYDMVGELLLSAYCLDGVDSDFYVAGWETLQAVQWREGVVPGPNYREEAHRTALKSGEEEGDSYVFGNCYHTTLVAALVGALCPPPRGSDPSSDAS
ncbi:DUF6895 family protein [Geodermatophilus pulveris]|uniref:DUF6895 family protein n=1 Tax=Geodermatophilus pulveris TaxID=1564159 RepID=UPI000B796ABA|nr:hypothetical protein [Geodermatophilus pulveris]